MNKVEKLSRFLNGPERSGHWPSVATLSHSFFWIHLRRELALCFDSWGHHCWLTKGHKTKTRLSMVVVVEPERCHCARGATVQCAIANGWVSGLTNLQNLSPSYLAHCCAIFLLSSWATNYIKPTDGNQRQTMQHHTLRVVFCNAHKKHVVQFGKALHLVAVQDKHKIWTTVHFWTSLQPQQKMLLDMVDVGFHKIHRP